MYGNLYTQRELGSQYNRLRDNNAAGFATVYNLNYESGDWNSTSKNYPVREIKGYRGGKPIYDSEQYTLNDILNMQDKNKKNINVSAHWSNVNGQQGIILATGADGKNRRFFIDANTMPESNIAKARGLFADAERLKKSNNPRDLQAARVKIENALMELHIGLTEHNTGYNQKLVEQPSLTQRDK